MCAKYVLLLAIVALLSVALLPPTLEAMPRHTARFRGLQPGEQPHLEVALQYILYDIETVQEELDTVRGEMELVIDGLEI